MRQSVGLGQLILGDVQWRILTSTVINGRAR